MLLLQRRKSSSASFKKCQEAVLCGCTENTFFHGLLHNATVLLNTTSVRTICSWCNCCLLLLLDRLAVVPLDVNFSRTSPFWDAVSRTLEEERFRGVI